MNHNCFAKLVAKVLLVCGMAVPLLAQAAETPSDDAVLQHADEPTVAPPHAMGAGSDHAKTPAGISGANMVKPNEVKLNLAAMYMRMQDNYIGSSKVSPQTIVTTIPSNVTMTTAMGTMREMYRIVPDYMNVETLMLSAMYGLSSDVNIMVMAPYVRKTMSMTTFAGSSGTTILGQSSMATQGMGDASVSSIWRFHQDRNSYGLLNVGLSLPTGSTTETTTMLSPMNMMMTSRANYGMQLGTGTYDFLPGLTYVSHDDQWSWGAAYRGRFALRNNAQGYHYGNRLELDLWGGYTVTHGVTLTARIAGSAQGGIHGSDPAISGLMQGSNPNYYGGRKVDAFAGLDLSGVAFGLKGVNLSLEAGDTVYQNLNGPQLGSSWQVNAVLGIIL